MCVAESEDDAVKQVQNTFDFLSNEDSDDEDEDIEWQQAATKVRQLVLGGVSRGCGLIIGAIQRIGGYYGTGWTGQGGHYGWGLCV